MCSVGIVEPQRAEKGWGRFAVDVAVCLLGFFMVYGYQMLKLGLLEDDIADLSAPLNWFYVAQGRFMVAVYRMLVGNEQMVPFAYGVSCAAFFSLAVTLQIRMLHVRRWWQRMVYVAASVGGIHRSVMLDYAGLADAVMLGALLVTLGYCYCRRWMDTRKWYWGIICIAATTAGICCYQVHVFLFCLLAVADALRESGSKLTLQRLLRPLSVAVVVAVCYLLLKYLSLRVMIHFSDENTYSYIRIAKGYQAGLIGWVSDSFWDNAASIGDSLLSLSTGRMWGSWVFPVALVPTLTLAWSWRRDCARLVLLGVLWLLPFVPVFMLGTGVVGKAVFYRLCFHDSVPVAVVWALAMVLVASYKVSAKAYESKRLYEFSARKAEECVLAAKLMGHTPRGGGSGMRGAFPFQRREYIL